MSMRQTLAFIIVQIVSVSMWKIPPFENTSLSVRRLDLRDNDRSGRCQYLKGTPLFLGKKIFKK
jgi:hypothetical protein